MNIKKILVFVLVFFISLGLFSQEHKKLYRIGIAPYVENELKSKDELRYVLSEKSKEIVNLFANYLNASSLSVANDFLNIVNDIDIQEDFIYPKERIESMIWKSKKTGQVVITHKLEWASQYLVPAYSFALIYGNQVFYFKVPKKCGNISLMKIETREADPEEMIQQTALDEIEEAFKKSPPPPPPRPRQAESRLEYRKPKPTEKTYKYRLFADGAASLYVGCHQKYIVTRIGLGPTEDGWGLNLIGGVSFPIEKDEPQWKNVFLFDGLLVYRKEIFRGGIGVGLATQMTDLKPNQTEIIVNATIMIKKNIGLFLEGRTPLNRPENETIVENNKIVIGLRFF